MPCLVYGQECNCPASFDWMVGTFEKNDAGFQYVIDKKGKEDYEKHTAISMEKAKDAKTLESCREVMHNWLHYFRKGHIAVNINAPVESAGVKELSAVEIRKQFENENKIKLNEKQFIAQLDKRKSRNVVEGIWTNQAYRIGIIADEKDPKKFTGFILKADSVYWMPGQIKMELRLNADNKTFSVSYAMRDHSRQDASAEFVSESKSLLYLFNNYWVRQYPVQALEKMEELQMRSSDTELPFIEKISGKTVYMRIPSFASEQKKQIDSVLFKYDKLITSSPNLIIDIRNGTGGSDDSYSEIIPYLYTNPMRGVGVQLYATELNAKAFEQYAQKFEDSSSKAYCNRVAELMRKSPGKFVQYAQSTFSVDTLDTILPYPQKVGIICNHNNGSTDEQFLLAAKQSRKVKIFGHSTGGMLDISNMNYIDFPDGKFQLGYCMSKSYRIPDFCIDGVGIQPDYFIDNAIGKHEWIEYVRKVLEE
ncbi:MAG: S41 family peptidase [Bacteroidia bacterium]